MNWAAVRIFERASFPFSGWKQRTMDRGFAETLRQTRYWERLRLIFALHHIFVPMEWQCARPSGVAMETPESRYDERIR